MTWAEETAERIRREGEEITRAEVEAIADRFRTQVGDAYALIADRLEHDHRSKP